MTVPLDPEGWWSPKVPLHHLPPSWGSLELDRPSQGPPAKQPICLLGQALGGGPCHGDGGPPSVRGWGRGGGCAAGSSSSFPLRSHQQVFPEAARAMAARSLPGQAPPRKLVTLWFRHHTVKRLPAAEGGRRSPLPPDFCSPQRLILSPIRAAPLGLGPMERQLFSSLSASGSTFFWGDVDLDIVYGPMTPDGGAP